MSHPIHHAGIRSQAQTRPIPPHFVSRAEAVRIAMMPLPPNVSLTLGGRTVRGGQAPVVLNRSTRPNVTPSITSHEEPASTGVDIGFGVSRDFSLANSQGAFSSASPTTGVARGGGPG
jgi:hypothetical protein